MKSWKIFWEIIKGLIPADKQAEAQTALQNAEAAEQNQQQQNQQPDYSKLPAEMRSIMEGMQAQIKTLTQQNSDLLKTIGEEKTTREAAIKAAQEQAAKDKEKKVNDAVEAAAKEGKITEAQKEQYKKLFTADFDSTDAIVKALPVNKQFQSKKEASSGKEKTETTEKSLVDPLLNSNNDMLAKVKQYAGVTE